VAQLDGAAANLIANAAMDDSRFTVTDVAEKPYTRRPQAPFTTSTLQQEASRKLRLSSKNAMRVAQRLYENGYITYMRTDSTTLSEAALTAARGQARDMYGAEYVPDSPRRYEKKVKNAQEAHEAIRPAGDSFRTPAQVAGELRGEEFALYELIWKRTVASQMADAKGMTRPWSSPLAPCRARPWPSSLRAARSSPSVDSSRPMRRAGTRSATTLPSPPKRNSLRSPSAKSSPSRMSRPRATRPAHRHATPRRVS